MKARIKIQGFLIFIAVISVIFFYKYLLPNQVLGIWRIIFDAAGIFLFLLGYFLRTVARGYKAELNPDGKTLVIKGPYSLTRNPMYLGTLLIGTGIILLILKWWVAAIFLMAYLWIYIPQIKKEESKLRGLFHSLFDDYCLVTPGFFPNIKSLLRPDSIMKLKASWVKKELSSFLAASTFILIVKTWELLCR